MRLPAKPEDGGSEGYRTVQSTRASSREPASVTTAANNAPINSSVTFRKCVCGTQVLVQVLDEASSGLVQNLD